MVKETASKPTFSEHSHLALRDFQFDIVERLRSTVNRGGQPQEVSLFLARRGCVAGPDSIRMDAGLRYSTMPRPSAPTGTTR